MIYKTVAVTIVVFMFICYALVGIDGLIGAPLIGGIVGVLIAVIRAELEKMHRGDDD